MALRFADRTQAGHVLAARLQPYRRAPNRLVLALPRGGVPVGFEVARGLEAPLDVFVVRKLGLPGHPELAMGAIASGGVRILNESVLEQYGVTNRALWEVSEREERELKRREKAYRGERPMASVEGRSVFLVDDGLATGATMKAAVTALRRLRPRMLVVAVPVAAPEVCDVFRAWCNDVICAATPHPFLAVGAWYDDFSQTEDDEVRDLLEQAAEHEEVSEMSDGTFEGGVRIQVDDGRQIEGDLVIPPRPLGIVLFAHGSGSSRFSPRNRMVAGKLHACNLGTLLLDLLTREEEEQDEITAEIRFDIDLLARRLVTALDWLGQDDRTPAQPVGLFGSSTGAGAALMAAARRPPRVGAVVSRGGRPDLAGEEALKGVRAPVLLIVGGLDYAVLDLNEGAMRHLQTTRRLEIVAGAGHLFAEPGTLDQVAELAAGWFQTYLPRHVEQPFRAASTSERSESSPRRNSP